MRVGAGHWEMPVCMSECVWKDIKRMSDLFFSFKVRQILTSFAVLPKNDDITFGW